MSTEVQAIIELQRDWMKQVKELREKIEDLETELYETQVANKTLQFRLEDKEETEKEIGRILAKHITRSSSTGAIYFDTIWSTYDKAEFETIRKYFNIPLTESEVNNED